MNLLRNVLSFVVLLTFSWFAHAEVIQFRNCPYPENTPINCTVHSADIVPCKEAEQGKPCRVKRGHNATITFDFTPEFDGTELQTRAYWASQVADLPFLGMNTNGCQAAQCPLTKGQRQTYSMDIAISKKFPIRTYDVKWKLWNEDDQECCFIFGIKLVR